MTQKELRDVLRKQLADQLPHLFPPNSQWVAHDPHTDVKAIEDSHYAAQWSRSGSPARRRPRRRKKLPE